MSSEHREPEERELDALLRHEHPVSRAYAASSQDGPPAALDAAVLQLARAALRPPRRAGLRRWQTPLAAAAVIVLAIGVLLRLPDSQPVVPTAAVVAEPPSRDAEVGEVQRAEAASVAASPAAPPDPMPREQRAARSARPPPAASTPEPASAPADVVPPAVLAAPPPVALMADTAGAPALREEAHRIHEQDAVHADEAPRAAAKVQVAPAERRKEAGAVPGPEFEGLRIGRVTRMDVHARFGAPAAPPAAMTEPLAAADDAPIRERYVALPGRSGSVEFVYERASTRLLAVIETPPPGTALATLIDRAGWREVPQLVQAPLHCALAPDARAAQYWLLHERAALIVTTASGEVLQLRIDPRCTPAE